MMLYFLAHKSDTLRATKQYLADGSSYGKVSRIRSDNGTEFLSENFQNLLIENRIKHELSCPYSPHQMGKVERGWRTLFSMARCMLIESKLPKNLWVYAILASAYIRNRCFNSYLGKTPFEIFTGSKPNLSRMHIFGTTCFCYVQNKNKLDPRSKEGILIGYDKQSPASHLFP